MSHLEHKEVGLRNLRCGIITISDTRSEESDESGRLIRKMLEESGHQVLLYSIVPDEASSIVKAAREALSQTDVVICNGGTGISRRDVTVEALLPILDTRIEGFGEIFRWISYQEIGSSAMLSRAVGGVVGKNLLFCLPGSPNAVGLAMRKLIIPEMGHMLAQVRK